MRTKEEIQEELKALTETVTSLKSDIDNLNIMHAEGLNKMSKIPVHLEKIVKRINEIKEEQENAPESTRLERLGFWKRGDQEDGFCLDTHGTAWNYSSDVLDNFPTSEKLGNSFKTEQDAQAAAKRREIMADLWRNSKEFEYRVENFYLFYNYTNEAVSVHSHDFCQNFGTPYFTEEKAQEMINKWGDDLKLLLV